MKAIGYKKTGSIDSENLFVEFETEMPALRKNDLLVKVYAISVNPVDTKVRKTITPEQKIKIIGYDAAGVVVKTKSKSSQFKIGDEVYYAGDITRDGTNAEFHAVDERIVGRKPKTLTFAEAAAIPLTGITAWEILFDAFKIKKTSHKDALLIIGGAGGVGSILIQLAKKLTNLKVIATASRFETIKWVEKMGADHIIDHQKSLIDQMDQLSIKPKYIASLTASDQHFDSIIEIAQPRAHIVLIDDPASLNIKKGKTKSLTFSWEFMFTRSMFQTADIYKQRRLLNKVSELIDKGILISTMNQHLGKINAENLKIAHLQQETGRVIGKNVLEGFD